jgi:uncharacterized protein YbgA (DUF1722 family)/uncharacterized protein YbbK (DUF523 family)
MLVPRSTDYDWLTNLPLAGHDASMTRENASMGEKPKLGISTCLLGEKVRYDGGHKRDRFLTDTFGQFVEWVPVCPEVECGLPVPRDSMRLEGDPENPRLIVTKTRRDLTDQMLAWARKRVKRLESENLAGYVFKSRSPSSGMERVRVYDDKGMSRKEGVGLFARAFMDHFPLLPVEEEGRLHDPHLRENFIERIFCLMRYRHAMGSRAAVGRLVQFHADHKIQLMAHSPAKLKQMGQLVAGSGKLSPKDRMDQYQALLLEALKMRATVKKNVNALQHMQGYFKSQLSAEEKQELREVIGQYREGWIPLVVPVTLIRHYVRKYEQPYLMTQSYLNPHPAELKLRNHA